MEVHFSPEIEAQLNKLATRAGKDAEFIVQDLIRRLIYHDEAIVALIKDSATDRITQNQLALHRAAALLNHMRQLVSQKLSACGIIGVVRSLSKKNIPAGGERHGVDGAVEGVCLGIGVYPDAAEVGAKGRFYVCS